MLKNAVDGTRSWGRPRDGGLRRHLISPAITLIFQPFRRQRHIFAGAIAGAAPRRRGDEQRSIAIGGSH